MLTPMLVQYLVGLCCLHHDPDAVEITVGDMVYDQAAQKARDVDVTVTFKNQDGSITAFKAAEVKKESTPLDVATVEQLCLKYMDMPQITHRSIFSTSGYTEPAKQKAAAHSVDLYTLKPWTRRIEEDFPDFKEIGYPDDFMRVEACLLRWPQYKIFLIVPDGPESFDWYNDTPCFSSEGEPHRVYSDLGKYSEVVARRSPDLLCTTEPFLGFAQEFIKSLDPQVSQASSKPLSHSHTMDVRSDGVFLKFGDDLRQITSLTIYGHLYWTLNKRLPEYYILQNEVTGKVFAGAAIADYGEDDGRMFAMIFPEKGRTLGMHRFCLTEKQKNIIHNLKLKSNGLL